MGKYEAFFSALFGGDYRDRIVRGADQPFMMSEAIHALTNIGCKNITFGVMDDRLTCYFTDGGKHQSAELYRVA